MQTSKKRKQNQSSSFTWLGSISSYNLDNIKQNDNNWKKKLAMKKKIKITDPGPF
jgi:hypothetical protein